MQTTTPTPDPTTIEEALLRIKVAANIVDTVAEVLRGGHERHGDTLVLMAGDIEHAAEAIRPVVDYLMRQEGRSAA